MSTPRTIKASEVVKGMRVRVELTTPDLRTLVEGRVEHVTPGATVWLTFPDDETFEYDNHHPVTVLAEPEPEWVEGAWYWITYAGRPRPMKRIAGGQWSHYQNDDWSGYHDSDEALEVHGRVLVVDWPGDDYASTLEGTYRPDVTWDDFECSTLLKVADAIRTQGGVR